jgi:TetR/AcrR family transcriptional regulator, fatty acid metabolism regulator protein
MPITKDRILAAAENLIAKDGFRKSTIAKVAQKALVADSLVYKYFKNKEDLLFSIATKRLEEAVQELKESLQGIKDPESLLRKLIWYSLRYNDHHPEYIRMLLFECRSNQNFYSAACYNVLKEHANITMGILEKGVREGVFRGDVNMGLIRDILYGTFDLEAISCFATGETERSIDSFDDIVNLVLQIIQPDDPPEKPNIETRILQSGEKIFSEHGFEQATLAAIAKSSGVAEGTIYDYFETKEALLFSITERHFQAHLEKMPNTFDIKSPIRKLRRLIRYHFTLYLPNRDFLKLFLLDVKLNSRFYESKAYTIYQQYLSKFEALVKEGQSSGHFRPDINPRVFKNMFLGAFVHMALRWLIVEKNNQSDKMMEIDQLVDMLSIAISNRGDSRK